ncbi:shikimate dehydrogenase [Buchnera aphidicola (Neophyllaphis varicolor)]|uniref:shikimate dehydrogenase n=1 Tax=Buchnera aphidicola TaxID=9 RepID=UPI0031B8A5E3
MIDFIKKNIRCKVFGNPINHSLSPMIHGLFSEQTGIKYNYSKKLVPVNNFKETLLDFFCSKKSNYGLNITVPFKNKAFYLCNKLTDRALASGSVNVIQRISFNSNEILGDNTDGIGLLYDLKRLNFIKSDSLILLLGVGDTSNNIIIPLLNFGCSIYVFNRTEFKIKSFVLKYKKYGKIFIFDPSLNNNFDLVINATSSSMNNVVPCFPKNIKFNFNSCCYDVFYSSHNTPFLDFCVVLGIKKFSDGLGMLVSQAAYSFYNWFGFLPDINSIINIVVKNIKNN